MAINERSRHELFARLEEILGKEHATVLMEHLPPVGWADVATKHDLDQLERRLTTRFDSKLDALRFELLAAFRAELNSQTRILIFGLVTAFAAVAGVALAALA
jgi:hypothetical protein